MIMRGVSPNRVSINFTIVMAKNDVVTVIVPAGVMLKTLLPNLCFGSGDASQLISAL